jgi:hypothetical protein
MYRKIKRISEKANSGRIFRNIFNAGMKGWFLDCLIAVLYLFRLHSVELVDPVSQPRRAELGNEITD